MSITGSHNNIPSHIWYKITQQLSQKDLFECQKVCKSWYSSTRPYCFWDNIELKTVKNVVSFLNGFPNDAKNYVKSIVIGNQHVHPNPPVEYTLSKEQSKELLLSLPNLEKVSITSSFAKSIIYGINNEEFLMEFRKNHYNISSINVIETPHVCPIEHCHTHRLPWSSTNILIDKVKHLSRDIRNSNLKLEYHTMVWNFNCFLELLYKIKMLPRMKYLDFNVFLSYPSDCRICIKDIPRIIDEDQELKEKLALIEKLSWIGYDNLFTNIITQYFIGLNEMNIYFSLCDFTSEFTNFIFSHDKYRLETNYDYCDEAAMCLKNHFIQNSTDNKKVTKHLWFELDCSDHNKIDINADDYNDIMCQIDIYDYLLFESKKIDENQLLKLAKVYLMESEFSLKFLYDILNSEKEIMEDINTLTFEITDNYIGYFDIDPEETCLVNYNTLRSIDQILSLATDKLKKVIIKSENCCKWSKYFVKYEKVNTYRQVTHLEVYICANNNELLDDLTLPQLTVVFPCINYLTLGYIATCESYTSNSNEIFVNLPHISLKKLTLDASILKLMARDFAKTQKDSSDTYFILKVEANQKLYNYQISLDFLNVTELEENDKELDMKKSLQVYIILNNIECLEFCINKVDIYEEPYSYDWYFEPKNTKEKTCNCKIYFE